METKFTHDLDSLKRINGSVASDKDIAKKAASEMGALAESLSRKIEDFSELRQVMTLSDEVTLRDAVTALRHLHYELKYLCQLFEKCVLIGDFDPVRVRVEKLATDAEESVELLLKHVYR